VLMKVGRKCLTMPKLTSLSSSTESLFSDLKASEASLTSSSMGSSSYDPF
jgi:hypothetical protein